MSSLLSKIFSSKKERDKKKDEVRKFRRDNTGKSAEKIRERGLGSMGAVLGGTIGLAAGDILGDKAFNKELELDSRNWDAHLKARSNSSAYTVGNFYADPNRTSRAAEAIDKEISSVNKLNKATEKAIKASKKYQKGSVIRGGLVGAGIGLAAGVGGAALINHNIKKKRKQKTFSDRDSAWWKKRIEELEKKDPNSPRLQKFREQLDYALAEEAKAKGASEEARAAGRAAEERMRNNSSAGRSSGGNSRWKDPWEEFRKSWNENFREKMRAHDNAQMDELFNKATENAKRNEASFAEAERYATKINKKNKKANKIAVGVGLASLGTIAGIKAYQHHKNKNKKAA